MPVVDTDKKIKKDTFAPRLDPAMRLICLHFKTIKHYRI